MNALMAVTGSRRWLGWVQFALGALLAVGSGFVVFQLWPRDPPPSGWQQIDPPGDGMALAELRGEIWAGGRGGLYRLSVSDGRLLGQIEADVALRSVTSLLVDQDGEGLWVGHSGGLSHWDGVAWKTLGPLDGWAGDPVLALARGAGGELWVGAADGLSRFLGGIWQRFTTADGMASNSVSALFGDSAGRLWAGNGLSEEGGLSMYDGQSWRTFTTQDGLAHERVNAIAELPQGTLWFGTGFSSAGGLTRYDGQAWEVFGQEHGLAGAKVRSLWVDPYGVLWAGSEYDGLTRLGERPWLVLTPDDGLSGWEVKSMLQDSQGNLWLGTERGLTRIEASAWRLLAEGTSGAR